MPEGIVQLPALTIGGISYAPGTFGRSPSCRCWTADASSPWRICLSHRCSAPGTTGNRTMNPTPLLCLLLPAAAALLGAITTTPASAAPLATLECQEHLGRDWPAELIHYDFTFAPGECLSTHVLVRDNSGREWAAQMSGVTRHADGSIQRAEVWWVVSCNPTSAGSSCCSQPTPRQAANSSSPVRATRLRSGTD